MMKILFTKNFGYFFLAMRYSILEKVSILDFLLGCGTVVLPK